MESINVSGRLPTGDQPKVTGLSPNEGPPGTKITIRGENLGKSPQDLIGLQICGVNCLMYADWKSSSKILARSGRCKGLGDVIVTTRSGGRGTCTVQFNGYEDTVSPTKESAVWINEDEYFVFNNTRHRAVSSPSLFAQDPLGLCPDEDSPTIRSKANESFKQLFPEGSNEKDCGNLLSPNFIPAWYLLENHSKASFKDLKKGLQCLKQKVNEKSPTSDFGPLTLLKPHVLAVIECLDALKAVNMALKKDKQDAGSDLTSKIEDSIQKALDEAHEIFDTVLTKKDMADSTRNALNVLQRYRFLFNLPSSIERNIVKGDYDIVINDYSRAKSLFSDTQVKVFQKVYAEVEQRINKFRDTLCDKLKAIWNNKEGRNIEELKKLVKYLTNLEVKGNPGWESVLAIKDSLLRSLIDCSKNHLSLAKSKSNNPLVVENDSLTDEDYESQEAPQVVQFLEEVTEIFSQNFSDVVKLGNAYLSGDMYIKETEDQLIRKEKYFSEEIIHKLIELVISLIRSALLPNTIKNIPGIEPWPLDSSDTFVIWLPHCLRTVTNFYEILRKQELSQNSDQIAQQLIVDLKTHSLICLFKKAAEEVKQLSEKENWDVHLDDAIGSRTQLPLLFESKVMEILQLIRETILQSSLPGETDIFSKINVQGQMKQLSQNLLQAFVEALEKTVVGAVTSPTTVLKNNPNYEHRMLIVICNCTFTTNQVLPRLHDGFEKYNYPNMNTVIKVVQSKYRELENKLLQEYIKKKCEPIIEGIDNCIYLIDKDQFATGSKPTDVSYYVKEALMNIIEVQAEVFSIAPPLVRKIMINVIDNAAEEYARLYAYLSDQMTESKNLQATLDLAALQYAFDNPENYKSLKSERMFGSCRLHLRDVPNPKDMQHLYSLLNQFKTTMFLQLACFRWKSEQTLITI
ncbi:Exocyst complex component 2-like protein [Dinothrombium tinctorium]|uniref:Exocyst complex component 2 n=1 Tax=Dinothrombium tinctorium TaxID=1965070 RepID=A0A3S3PYX3_9ACAR|nr:Exocyst complex component 2-like protein [Dinothrombium tinctorium]